MGTLLYPALVAAFPVLFLWAQNTAEAPAGTALAVTAVVVAVTVAVQVVASLLLRNLAKGALTAAVAAALWLSWGHVWDERVEWLQTTGFVLWLVIAMATVWLVARTDRDLSGVGPRAAIVAVAMVALELFTIVPAVVEGQGVAASSAAVVAGASEIAGAADAGAQSQAASGQPQVGPDGTPLRDIFYIIPDRYGRADQLEEAFGYDNTPFVDSLESRGFEVADDSYANYPLTVYSLFASTNMGYVQSGGGGDPQDWAFLYNGLYNNRVGLTLNNDYGYEYLHLGSWSGPTTNTASDRNINFSTENDSEFVRTFTATTILPRFQSLVGIEPASFRTFQRDWVTYTLDELDRLAVQPQQDRPRYVVAHLTLPHDPYVFEPDGTFVPRELEEERGRDESHVRQLEYANLRLSRVVDELLARPEDEQPIIIIQADEGSRPLTYANKAQAKDNREMTDGELRERLAILAAYYLPGLDDSPFYDQVSPVNTFRMVFDSYLGTDLGLLPDRSFVFPDVDRYYDFAEVTDRTR